MTLKTYKHNPAHLFVDGATYFITGGILHKQSLLHDDKRKQLVYDGIQKWFGHFGWPVLSWVILANHYHLVTRALNSLDLSRIINRLHGSTSFLLNKLDGKPGRQVWWNYWDRCVRDENEMAAVLRYTYCNAVKHGLATEAANY